MTALALALGHVVTVVGVDYVVGSITANLVGEVMSAQLFSVPAGKLASDFGKTWQRSDPGVQMLQVSTAVPLVTTTDLEPVTP